MMEIRALDYDGHSGLGQDIAICKSNTGAAPAAAELLPWPFGPYVTSGPM